MMQKTFFHKRYIRGILAALVFFMVIVSFSKRKNNEHFLISGSGTNTFDLRTQGYITSYNALQRQDFEKIIQTLPKQTAQDYYNHGTILLAYAYTLSKEDGYQDHIQAYERINQAQRELEIAKTYASKPFENKVQTNYDIAKYIDTTIQTQLCISSLDESYKQILALQSIVSKPEIPKTIPTIADISCAEKLNNHIQSNYTQRKSLEIMTQERKNTIQTLLYQYHRDIDSCAQRHNPITYTDITREAQQTMEQYILLQDHIENQDREEIEHLCTAQNDNLQTSTIKETIEKIQEEQLSGTGNQSQQEAPGESPSSGTIYGPAYETIEDNQRKNIVDTVRETQAKRIQHIQQTETTTQQKLQEIFHEFYGKLENKK